jgi:hypothetical protein
MVAVGRPQGQADVACPVREGGVAFLSRAGNGGLPLRKSSGGGSGWDDQVEHVVGGTVPLRSDCIQASTSG